MRTGGRQKAKIDLNELERLCEIQVTQPEIAAFFHVSTRTIEKYAQKPEFREIMERGYKNGLISLKRAQFNKALEGNPTMLIWMGKQLLGQRDNLDTTLSAPGGGPLEVSVADSARAKLLDRINRVAARIRETGVGSEPHG